MLDNPRELAALLEGGPLGGRAVYAIDLPRSGERVLTVPAQPAELMVEWAAARALLEETGRWPVAAWGRPLIWGAPTLETFWLDPRGEKPLPADVCRAAAKLTGARAIGEIRAAQRDGEASLEELLEWHLRETRRRCGTVPEAAVIDAAFAGGGGKPIRLRLGHGAGGGLAEVDLERWLLDWEEEHAPTPAPELADWDEWFQLFEDDVCHLLFLPTSAGAETLAYLEFWAEESIDGATAERLIAVLASWQARYGAELVAHWGTMLQFAVTRPPGTLDEAWELAVEHDLIAPSKKSLTGQSLRDSARMLWRRPTWFLHERP